MTFDNWWKEYGKDLDSCEYVVAKDSFRAGQEASGEKIATLGERCNQLLKDKGDLKDNYDQFKAIAEPEIERLKKENAELRNNGFTVSAMTEQQLKVALEKGERLEKENAELKEKKIKGCYFGKDELGNDFFAKCDCVDCQKRTIALLDLRKEYLNKINKEKTINEQLTKAKEILKMIVDYYPCYNKTITEQAEQFLSEIEK